MGFKMGIQTCMPVQGKEPKLMSRWNHYYLFVQRNFRTSPKVSFALSTQKKLSVTGLTNPHSVPFILSLSLKVKYCEGGIWDFSDKLLFSMESKAGAICNEIDEPQLAFIIINCYCSRTVALLDWLWRPAVTNNTDQFSHIDNLLFFIFRYSLHLISSRKGNKNRPLLWSILEL